MKVKVADSFEYQFPFRGEFYKAGDEIDIPPAEARPFLADGSLVAVGGEAEVHAGMTHAELDEIVEGDPRFSGKRAEFDPDMKKDEKVAWMKGVLEAPA